MLTICNRNGFKPARARARRKVASCSSGEHEATTTRFRLCSAMSCSINAWPGSEHMYLYSRETTTFGKLAA